MRRKFYIYSRCSTEDQRKHGHSHSYQIDGILSSPKVREKEHLGTFSDTITGTTFERPELLSLYRMCQLQRGTVDYLFVYRWDRFGRDVGDAFDWIKKFLAVGVEVNCLDSMIDFSDSNWPVLLGVTFGMAQAESLKISDRTRDGQYSANAAGYYIASSIVGYKRVPRNGEKTVSGKQKKVLQIDKEKAPWVKKSFLEYLQNRNRGEIFHQYKSKLGISKSSFYRMLTNPIYCGEIHLKPYKHNPARIVQAVHKPIISKMVFYDVQKALEEDASQRDKPYRVKRKVEELFMKKVIKSQEGKPMTSYYSRSKSGRLHGYYETKGEKESIISAKKAHHIMSEAISTMELNLSTEYQELARERFMLQLGNVTSEASDYRVFLENLKKKLTRLEQDYLSGDITARMYTDLSSRIELQIMESDRRLRDLEKQSIYNSDRFHNFFEHLQKLPKMYNKLPDYKKVTFLQAMFPHGFTIEKPQYTVRTPMLNKIVDLFLCNTATYDYIKIKTDENFPPVSRLGDQWDTLRTLHLIPLLKLIS